MMIDMRVNGKMIQWMDKVILFLLTVRQVLLFWWRFVWWELERR